jgi:hypothetical protein
VPRAVLLKGARPASDGVLCPPIRQDLGDQRPHADTRFIVFSTELFDLFLDGARCPSAIPSPAAALWLLARSATALYSKMRSLVRSARTRGNCSATSDHMRTPGCQARPHGGAELRSGRLRTAGAVAPCEGNDLACVSWPSRMCPQGRVQRSRRMSRCAISTMSSIEEVLANILIARRWISSRCGGQERATNSPGLETTSVPRAAGHDSGVLAVRWPAKLSARCVAARPTIREPRRCSLRTTACGGNLRFQTSQPMKAFSRPPDQDVASARLEICQSAPHRDPLLAAP